MVRLLHLLPLIPEGLVVLLPHLLLLAPEGLLLHLLLLIPEGLVGLYRLYLLSHLLVPVDLYRRYPL